MTLAAEKLGPEAFQEVTKKGTRQLHFWYSEGTRPYMNARAALVYLLWRKLGKLHDAIAHFQELLRLNPGDNQGNRHALLCCLVEAGDGPALGEALERHRTYGEESVEPVEITDTCWRYTYACWLFRRTLHDAGSQRLREATKALRTTKDGSLGLRLKSKRLSRKSRYSCSIRQPGLGWLERWVLN
jgi:tetratricopeptide (TPR) repeat protein